MADKAISALTEATVINDADRFVLEQGGQAKQISGATMISEFAEALDGHGGIQSIDLVGGEGNAKTYRITFTDGTTYDYEVRDGESGNYAVVAGNLAPYSSDSGATQSVPFLKQGTGRGNGAATVNAGNNFRLKKLGNTVAVNQLVDAPTSGSTTVAGVTVSWNNGKATLGATATSTAYITLKTGIPTVSGHKLLVMGLATEVTGVSLYDDSSPRQFNAVTTRTIFTASGANVAFKVRVDSGISPNCVVYPLIIDLTLWFGSNDRIPSDLLSHPEHWWKYYAGALDYAAGYLDSANGTILTCIHRNIWEEQTELGRLDTSSGANVAASNQLRTQGYLEVNPATAYYLKSPSYVWVLFYDDAKNVISSGLPAGNYAYSNNARGIGGTDKDPTFTTPPNCSFIRFYMQAGYGTTYKNDITVSLYYSGESGYDTYYPYSVLAEADTGSEVLRSAGTVADEKTPDGTITRRVGVVDMGTLVWTYYPNLSCFYARITDGKPLGVYGGGMGRCAKYSNNTASPFNNMPDKTIDVGNGFGASTICSCVVKDSSYTDAATFKTALSGVYLYYELATLSTEQGTAFAENIPCNPVGSMSWENTNGIPQGAEIFYPFDYAGTLDSMLKALPSANGTYTFKATVANGKITYSWVAD